MTVDLPTRNVHHIFLDIVTQITLYHRITFHRNQGTKEIKNIEKNTFHRNQGTKEIKNIEKKYISRIQGTK